MALTNLGLRLDLITTTETALTERNPAVKDGTIYFTTDQNNLYADIKGARHCFNSIWFRDSFDKLAALPIVDEVLYWDTTGNNGYRYINGTLTKILSSDSVSAVSIVPVNSLSDITSPASNAIYAVGSDDTFASNAYNLYMYVNDSFVQVTPSKTNIADISGEVVTTTLTSMETDLAAIRDSLKAGTIGDNVSEYYGNIEEFYNNTYTKGELYTKTEVDQLVTTLRNDLVKHDNENQGSVKVTEESTDGVIVLRPDVSFYTFDMANATTISFDKSRLEFPTNNVISIELLVKGAKTITPVYNPAPTWVDEIEPTYYNNTIIGLRSFDNGVSWIAYYQGGWD